MYLPPIVTCPFVFIPIYFINNVFYNYKYNVYGLCILIFY